MDKQADPSSPLVVVSRALGLLALGAFSVGAAIGSLLLEGPLEDYFARNQISPGRRSFLLQWMLGSAAAAVVAAATWLWNHRRQPASAQHLYAAACRLSPVYFAGFLPFLFQWRTWRNQPLTFLVLVALFSLGIWGALRVAQRMPALTIEAKIRDWVTTRLDRFQQRYPRVIERLPVAIVVAAALAYVLYFSYYTICYHYAVRSGFDLGIKNNIFWNTLHGRAFFKASITLGPSGSSHFGRHADLLVHFLLPFYYLYQRPEALLIPPDAKVACSALTAPQFSSREDAYDMNQGFWDADYLVFPTEPSQFIANEKREVGNRLSTGQFGVVKIHPPFALAKRGYPTTLNESLLGRWR